MWNSCAFINFATSVTYHKLTHELVWRVSSFNSVTGAFSMFFQCLLHWVSSYINRDFGQRAIMACQIQESLLVHWNKALGMSLRIIPSSESTTILHEQRKAGFECIRHWVDHCSPIKISCNKEKQIVTDRETTDLRKVDENNLKKKDLIRSRNVVSPRTPRIQEYREYQ